jgi:hypothetical protein
MFFIRGTAELATWPTISPLFSTATRAAERFTGG